MAQTETKTAGSSSDEKTTPGPVLAKLNIFSGRWKVTGKAYGTAKPNANPYAYAQPWEGENTYEWLPGEFFMEHRWDAIVGGNPFNGLQVFGYNHEQQAYTVNHFDNGGYAPVYKLTEENNIWTFTGDVQCATIEVSNDGNTLNIHWDWKNQSPAWQPLCDLTATRTT